MCHPMKTAISNPNYFPIKTISGLPDVLKAMSDLTDELSYGLGHTNIFSN